MNHPRHAAVFACQGISPYALLQESHDASNEEKLRHDAQFALSDERNEAGRISKGVVAAATGESGMRAKQVHRKLAVPAYNAKVKEGWTLWG